MRASDLAGRPEAHLLARLACDLAPDLLAAATPAEWTLRRDLPEGILQQRLHRPARPAALRRALAEAPDPASGGLLLPSARRPVPRAFWIDLRPAPFPPRPPRRPLPLPRRRRPSRPRRRLAR